MRATQILPTKLSEYQIRNSSNNFHNNTSPLATAINEHRLNKRNVHNDTASDSPQASDTPQINVVSATATVTETTLKTILATEDKATTIISNKDTYKINPKIQMKGSSSTNGGRKISVLVHNITLLSDDERRSLDEMENKK